MSSHTTWPQGVTISTFSNISYLDTFSICFYSSPGDDFVDDSNGSTRFMLCFIMAAIWTNFDFKKIEIWVHPQLVIMSFFWCYQIYATIQNGRWKQFIFKIRRYSQDRGNVRSLVNLNNIITISVIHSVNVGRWLICFFSG